MKGFKNPGGLVWSKAGMMHILAGERALSQQTYDNYPAARAIMQRVFDGLQLPFDLALR